MKPPTKVQREVLEDIAKFANPWHRVKKADRGRAAGFWANAVAEVVRLGWATRTSSARYFLTEAGKAVV